MSRTNPLEAQVIFRDINGKHARITRMNMSLNSVPLEVDCAGDHDMLVLHFYRAMYKHLGQLDRKGDCNISLDNYKDG